MNLLLYIALRAASALMAVLPARVMYLIADLSGNLAYILFRRPRAALSRNLAVVFNDTDRSRKVQRAVRLAFQCDAKNWVDTLRIGRLDSQSLRKLVDIDGFEYLERAYARGAGVVLVGMHLGNFDLVGQVLAFSGYRVIVPVEHMHPESLFAFIMKSRTARGIQAIPVDRAPREMLRGLARGEIVAVVADRHISGRTLRVTFFGHETSLPAAAASLARRTGAPILVGVGVRKKRGRFQGHIVPVDNSDSAGGRILTEKEVMQRITDVMEGIVRRYPDQWLAFAPVWQEGTAGEPVATIRQPETDSSAVTGANR